MRATLLLVVAFALGALAAGSIGVRVIREVNTADDATSLPASAISTTQPAIPAGYQIDPHETLIASTSLIPTSLEATGSGVVVGYDLVTLSPHEGVPPVQFLSGVIESGDLDHIYPRSWELTTSTETILGGPADPSARVARFDVPDDFSIGEVRSIRITEAFAPYPVVVPFTLSVDQPSVEIHPGVTVELLGVADRGTTSIVEVAIDADDPELAAMFVQGHGPGWRPVEFETDRPDRVVLVWVGGALPQHIALVAHGTVWVPLEGPFDVSLASVE